MQQDYAEAARLYLLAADQGSAEAQNNLGAMYAKGQGVPQDYLLADMWFTLAAERGYPGVGENINHAKKYLTPEQIAEAEKMAREWKSTTGK